MIYTVKQEILNIEVLRTTRMSSNTHSLNQYNDFFHELITEIARNSRSWIGIHFDSPLSSSLLSEQNSLMKLEFYVTVYHLLLKLLRELNFFYSLFFRHRFLRIYAPSFFVVNDNFIRN